MAANSGYKKCTTSVNQIQLLQNKARREITFNKLHDSTHAIYNELSILKFQDLIYLQNCIFMLQIEQNENLDVPFPGLKYCGEHQIYNTRSKTQKLFDILNNKLEIIVLNCIQMHCIKDWNKFTKDFSNIDLKKLTYAKAKNLIKIIVSVNIKSNSNTKNTSNIIYKHTVSLLFIYNLFAFSSLFSLFISVSLLPFSLWLSLLFC